MTDTPKLVTEPHNAFLLETCRAFQAEGLAPPAAMQMTMAHIQHANVGALNRIACALESLVAIHTDPVKLSQFQAMLDAQNSKRSARRHERAAEAESDKVQRELFGDAGL